MTTATKPTDADDHCVQCQSPNVERIEMPFGLDDHRSTYAHCHDCGHAEPRGRALR